MLITKQSPKKYTIELNAVDVNRLSFLSPGQIFSNDHDMRKFQERLMYHLLTVSSKYDPNES